MHWLLLFFACGWNYFISPHQPFFDAQTWLVLRLHHHSHHQQFPNDPVVILVVPLKSVRGEVDLNCWILVSFRSSLERHSCGNSTTLTGTVGTELGHQTCDLRYVDTAAYRQLHCEGQLLRSVSTEDRTTSSTTVAMALLGATLGTLIAVYKLLELFSYYW